MGVTLAELRLLGKNTRHSQVGYIGHRCGVLATDMAVYFDSKLRKLKLRTFYKHTKVLVQQR